MGGAETSRLGELSLAWLLTRADGKGARSDLSRALKPFTGQRWSSGEWSARLDEVLAGLEADGLVRQSARKGLTLTAEGRTRGLAALRVPRLPKGTTWKKLKGTHLVALALGLEPSPETLTRLGRADGIRAVLVQQQLGMEAPGGRSLAQVRDALCWRQLGVETDKPFTLAAVQAVLLGRALQSSREVAAGPALQQLAAKRVGARRTDTESLRLAALRAWLFTSSSDSPAPVEAPAPAGDDGLGTFAGNVLRAARGATTGRFGEDRVFINHVWNAMRSQGLDERAFKRRLIEANQKRLLSLSRADMVELMDPSDVAASEIQYLGATFHFIALP